MKRGVVRASAASRACLLKAVLGATTISTVNDKQRSNVAPMNDLNQVRHIVGEPFLLASLKQQYVESL